MCWDDFADLLWGGGVGFLIGLVPFERMVGQFPEPTGLRGHRT